ncbi:UTP--glucose-1-phosphate uridylyltransferase [Jannaschia pohangensis]|uniref:UTP--glucose-1-phosphate uridylyltransferase n=1 Tax=Jannaschia pohangensis TaxID=390807 RepID=A0A1I3JX01_9RHOB|nr:sugar phosphate nucleotidyltransferase [Jannaschia pohangensis]SFI64704.1 UTP--glucose-1-phosphate uridylyltransferase [Jannaschia pohangensis]
MQNLETVVFPVAGLGTRMLPATKVTPKELLPVYDTPLLQFAVEEALDAGARHLIFVIHPDKTAIESYIRPAPALEKTLVASGKEDLLQAVRRCTTPSDVKVTFVMQHEPKGLGHAVHCALPEGATGPVGIILPDDLILGAPCLTEMTNAFDPETMTSLVAAQQVPRQKVSSYGIFDCDDDGSQTTAARGFVEKPAQDDAPSTLAAVGRYILMPGVFDVLGTTGQGAGGEIQLTDAIADSGGVHAFRFTGQRFDCGSVDGMVDATLAVQAMRKRAHLSFAAE